MFESEKLEIEPRADLVGQPRYLGVGSSLSRRRLVENHHSPALGAHQMMAAWGYGHRFFAAPWAFIALFEYVIGLWHLAKYERTPKSEGDYRAIAKKLMGERAVERILYLVSNHDLLSFVAQFFEGVRLPIFFGLVPAWHERLLDMPVFNPNAHRHSSLREVLQ
jgi:hypothetical protein